MKENVQKKISKWFWILITLPVALVLMGLLLVALFAKIPSFEQIENPDSNLATLLISEDGKVLNTYHIENRSYVSYDQIPQYVIDAAVATEDERFYRHSGIDFRGLGRVAVKTLLLGNSSQGGGSTISQQLAKTLYPRQDVSSRIPGGRQLKMIAIKFKEWITAVKIERNYTKDEIVTMYLNQIFFGGNAYGIKAASNTFFAKDPEDLTIEEGACLVGMVNKPTRYNPALNPEQSLARRNHVLHQMERNDYLTRAQYDSITQIPIVVTYRQQDHNSGYGPYFRDMLRKFMNAKQPRRSDYAQVEDYRADSLSWKENPLYGWLTKNLKPDGTQWDLDRDGLRIYTTLDSRMQKYAEAAVAQHLGKELQNTLNKELRYRRNYPFADDVTKEEIERLMRNGRRWSDRWRGLKEAGLSDAEIQKTFDEPVPMRVFAWNKNGYIDTTMTPNDSIKYYKSFLRAAFMAIEPNTGHVKAYVGGPDYRFFKYDNVSQGKRQVGSTFKPFLYTLAMQEGYTPCDKVANTTYTIDVNGTDWAPKSEVDDRIVTLKWGLTNSRNNISAYLMKQFGPFALVDICRKMGVSSYLDPVVSLCVGSCDLNVMEMVSAYNTFPGRGVYCFPMFVTRIEDNSGNVLATFSTRKREAISEITAYKMINMMQGVVNDGTAGRIRWRYNIKGDIAGKTGTTNDNSDGWFIGYTPKLTAGVWVGGEDRQVHFVSTANGAGASMALPIWALFMQKVYQDGTIPIGEGDVFVPPLGWTADQLCDGSSDDASDAGSGNDYFN
ncbi:MAG: transglycosylase domain-containing protein [Bacteroidales bacterium]|nr:transglycosylase domain-containing protein [Bacteroidales bacterium]